MSNRNGPQATRPDECDSIDDAGYEYAWHTVRIPLFQCSSPKTAAATSTLARVLCSFDTRAAELDNCVPLIPQRSRRRSPKREAMPGRSNREREVECCERA